MKRLRPLLVLALLVGGGWAAYAYVNRPPTSLVLTGIVTTNDVIVSPQIGGPIDRLLGEGGDTPKRDQLVAGLETGEQQAHTPHPTHQVAKGSSHGPQS